MFYTLLTREASFKNKNTQPEGKGRLVLILSLSNKQIALFYDNFWFYHIQTQTQNVIYQQKLQGKAFDGIVVNKFKIIIMLVERKSLIQIDLQSKRVKQIYKISQDSIYNSKKQVAYFFLSKLCVFNLSQTYYLHQDLTDERKIRIVYFPKVKNIELQKKPFQIKQLEWRSSLCVRLDQNSKIARFKQNPEQNGSFSFQQIDLQTNQKSQFKINNSSFVLFSTIIDIKKITDEKYLICLNSKNSQHETLTFNKIERSVQVFFTSSKIMKQCISINLKLNVGMFSFLYGSTAQSEIIQIVNLYDGQVIDSIQLQIDRISLSKDQMYLVQYSRQNRIKKQTKFKVLGFISKQTYYLKIMQNLKIDLMYGNDFMDYVASMLKQEQK